MRKFLNKFRKNTDGNATVEFTVVFPFLMFLILMIFEIGWFATRNVLLERGVDIVVRELRLAAIPDLSHDNLKARICEESTILADCDRDMILELVQLDLNDAYPQNQPNCIDRTGEVDPTISFNPGAAQSIMFVRACMIVDPIFPGLGITLGMRPDSSGGYQMVAYSAFMNEPS